MAKWVMESTKLFYVLFLSFIYGFLPAHGRKTDYIINMA